MAAPVDLLRDTRLSSDARIVVLEVQARGEGEHEISFDEWSMLLNQAGRERIRKALSQAEVAGWIERHTGGGGHSDRYSFTRSESEHLKNRRSNTEHLKPGENPPGKEKGGVNPPPNGNRCLESEHLNDPDEGDIGGEGEGGGAPAREEPDLHSRAEQLIEEKADALEGCRGALRDYLDQFIDRDRHYFYTQQILAFLEEIQPNLWKWPNGRPVAPEDRPAMIAEGLNKLASGDETTMKRPVGSPDNLETKIEFVIKRRWRQRDNGDDGPSGDSDAGQDRPKREFAI